MIHSSSPSQGLIIVQKATVGVYPNLHAHEKEHIMIQNLQYE